MHEKWQANHRQLNVSVDVREYRPVAEATLVARMAGADAGHADPG